MKFSTLMKYNNMDGVHKRHSLQGKMRLKLELSKIFIVFNLMFVLLIIVTLILKSSPWWYEEWRYETEII